MGIKAEDVTEYIEDLNQTLGELKEQVTALLATQHAMLDLYGAPLVLHGSERERNIFAAAKATLALVGANYQDPGGEE